MNFDEARVAILQVLQREGKAKNSRLVELLCGDAALFDRVREDLLFEELVEDRRGAGLIYSGPAAAIEPHAVECPPADAPTNSTADRRIPRRVFISYGRADAQDLAFQLERDLSAAGHTVWLDRQQIQPGHSWEEQIERGILGCDVFLALLSPHAVRRPDGVCLDEISLARYNSRRIVPAMILLCRPPLGIYRLDWIDFQDWQRPARYEQAVARLLATLEGTEHVEGQHARIFSTLKPLDFGTELARLQRDFTGREWLLAEIDLWLSKAGSRLFFVTGDPGTGKSAVMSQLVHQDPRIVAYHFCVASLADSLDPARFVHSISAQLATQCEGYRAALDAVDLEDLAQLDPATLFRRLIADPLRAEPTGPPLVILVDALDEARLHGERNIPRLLCERLDDLPDRVRIVASSRKEPEILDLFGRFRPREIDAGSRENQRDIAEYTLRKLQTTDLMKCLDACGANPSRVAELIVRKGEGNFLYVTQVLAGIAAGQINPQQPESVPDGLVGIYHSYFERIFPGGRGYSEFRPLLDVLTAAREPISADRLAAVLGRDTFDVALDLEQVAGFFPERNGLHSAYHKSITDWLCGRTGRSRLFRINFRHGHQLLGEALLEAWKTQGKSAERFVLAHLPSHLTEAERHEDCQRVLTDLDFVSAKCGAGLVSELVSDYGRALPHWLVTDPRHAADGQQAEARRIFVAQLKAVGDGGNCPRRLSSVRIVDPSTDLPNALRIPPSEELSVWRSFVANRASELATGLAPIWQLAYNHAQTGPVHEAAVCRLAAMPTGCGPWLRQIQRPPLVTHPACCHTLEGHRDAVMSVALTPDGRFALSGSVDRNVRLWDVDTGACRQVLAGHERDVSAVAMTPDAAWGVSGSGDHTVRLWDLTAGVCCQSWDGHTGRVQAVAITPRGDRVVSAGDDRTVRVWDVATSRCILALEGHQLLITAVSVTPDGRWIATGSMDRTVRIWDVQQAGGGRILSGHWHPVLTVELSPDGRQVISANRDGGVLAWDVASGESLWTRSVGLGRVRSLRVSSDGRYALVALAAEDSLQVVDLESGSCLKKFAGHAGSVHTMGMTPDAWRAVSGSTDHTLRVWDIATGQGTPAFPAHSSDVLAMASTGDGRWVVSASTDHTLRVSEVATGNCRATLRGHLNDVLAVATFPDGARVVSGAADWSARIWDLDRGELIQVLEGPGTTWTAHDGTTARTSHQNTVSSVGITPDGRRIVTAGWDRMIRIWESSSGACLHKLEAHRDVINTVVVSPDGRFAASAAYDRTVCLWDLATGKLLTQWQGHRDDVRALAFASNGRWVVSGSRDRTVRVWDVIDKSCCQVLAGHGDRVDALAISADSSRVLSGGWDGVLCLRELSTGVLVRRLEGQRSPVVSVALTPDGRFGITGSRNRAVKVWNLETGQPIAVCTSAGGIPGCLSVTWPYVQAGTNSGWMDFLQVESLTLPDDWPVTAVRLYQYGERDGWSDWDSNLTVRCPRCGRRAAIEDAVSHGTCPAETCGQRWIISPQPCDSRTWFV